MLHPDPIFGDGSWADQMPDQPVDMRAAHLMHKLPQATIHTLASCRREVEAMAPAEEEGCSCAVAAAGDCSCAAPAGVEDYYCAALRRHRHPCSLLLLLLLLLYWDVTKNASELIIDKVQLLSWRRLVAVPLLLRCSC